ncbi:MAG: class I SAM-dependent methyltransferase [Proteobacteria bacterium]|nr:class I SAM-dependent methyltransferase [Pseudomonadota bacterium]
MSSAAPPRIFAPHRRRAARLRARQLRERPGAATYLHADMAEDVLERIGFLRHTPARALVIGDWSGTLAPVLAATGVEVLPADPVPQHGELALDDEAPFPAELVGAGFNLIVALGTLDTVNDLPGALIHMRRALAPGGLMLAQLAGAGCLPALRAAMLAADGERPAPRLHPMVDVRAGGQLLQRAGLADPVVDSRGLAVRFGSLEALVADLRAQGCGNVLADPGPACGKQWLARARQAFADQADARGRTPEHFEILTLSGWCRS